MSLLIEATSISLSRAPASLADNGFDGLQYVEFISLGEELKSRVCYVYKLYWVDNDNSGVLFNLGEVLEKYGDVFIGRLSGEDVQDAEKRGVLVEDYSALHIFKPGAFYHYMKLEDPYVSRRHARIELRGGGLYIIDHGHEGRGSTNGTFINGKRINPMVPHRLKHGDEVSLGSTTKFIVVHGDRALSIDTPITLGRNEIDELRRRGVSINVSYSGISNKYTVFIREEIETPIKTPSGLVIQARPDPIDTIERLIIDILETISKLDKGESDARNSIHDILAKYDVVAIDIESFLRKRKSLRNLNRIEKAVRSLENYAKGYTIDKNIARENLEELKRVLLKAIVDVQ